LVIYEERIHQVNDQTESDHFENIQSTNWQTMRFKPPPPGSSIGWRVEFRPMELQLTDFENAAYVVFVILLTRVIISFNLNFYIPISKVEENLANAIKRRAVINNKFYFRQNITPHRVFEPNPLNSFDKNNRNDTVDTYGLYTINEIINGKDKEFFGIIPLINRYLETTNNIDIETRIQISNYMELISKRASGELLTPATWMRNFIRSHPSYKQDSVVAEDIAYDLFTTCRNISNGVLSVPELLGNLYPPNRSNNTK